MRMNGRLGAMVLVLGLAIPGAAAGGDGPALGNAAAQARMRELAARRVPTTSHDPVATLNRLYVAFLSGDAATVLDLAADDVVLEVVGPAGRAPFYGTFRGKAGVLAFLYAAAGAFVVEDLDVTYQVVDGRTVNSVFIETRRYHRSGATAITQMSEETIFDAAGKIRFHRVLQDQMVELAAYEGAAGEVHRTSYPSPDIRAPRYARPHAYAELVAFLALQSVAAGEAVALAALASPDAEFVLGGEGVASFSGRHVGAAALADLAAAFGAEVEATRVQSVISQGNKGVVNFVLEGRSSATGRTYRTAAALVVQLGNDGRIASADLAFDQYAAFDASRETAP